MASWSPRRTRSPSAGAGFTAYYVKQNVTSSLSARPGSVLKTANNCGLASCPARPRPGRARPAALPPPLPAVRFWRAEAGVVARLAGRRAPALCLPGESRRAEG